MALSPDLTKMAVAELKQLAETLEISNATKLKKNELIDAITASLEKAKQTAKPEVKAEIPRAEQVGNANAPGNRRNRVKKPVGEIVEPVKSVKNEVNEAPQLPLEQTPKQEKPVAEIENSGKPVEVKQNPRHQDRNQNRNRRDQRNQPVDKELVISESDLDAFLPPLPETENKEEEVKAKPENQNTNNNRNQLPQDDQRRPQNPTDDNQMKKEKIAPIFEMEGVVITQGVLETVPDGYGFLRSPDYNYMASPDDVYVPGYMIKQNGLKTGDTVRGSIRPPKDNEKYFCIVKIESVNGRTLEEVRDRVSFEHLTPLFPNEKLNLCDDPKHYSNRIIDLVSPIGKGQRGLIVSQPKTGKTWLLQGI
ncbi:MAG: Rho termination factor N-terminal domain-containing protein, partial [Bacteroidia bacterium]|nr:Rho termination factor N-terminal domain-containing protein [Bacteroidia bacterium]